jgi:hypothetical protein
MHRVVGKLISNVIMMKNLIFEIKSYASKPKVILTRFEEKTASDTLYL